MSVSLVSRRVPLLRSVASRALSTSQPRCDFGWQKLVTAQTHPSWINHFKEIDARFAAMKAQMFGVAPKVEEIDWAQWEATISNKAAVAALRKEYESTTFETSKGEDLTKVNAHLDGEIAGATRAASVAAEELPKAQAELARAIRDKKEVHNWTLEDYYKNIPGLEEQLREEYMNGEFLPSEAEQRLVDMDWNELRKQLRSGQELTLPEGLPDRIGNKSLKEEYAKVSTRSTQ